MSSKSKYNTYRQEFGMSFHMLYVSFAMHCMPCIHGVIWLAGSLKEIFDKS